MSDEAVTGPDLAARKHSEETRTANAIYGVIVSTAVMASVKRGDSVGRLAVAVLVTLLVYWAAERYAHVMARRIGLGRKQTHAEVRRELSDGWELVTASFLPLLVLLGTHVLGVDLSGSVLSALACSTVLLGLVGWRVGREAQLRLVERLLSAAFAGAIGIVMIVLKTTLH
jgi:hypothetical protein